MTPVFMINMSLQQSISYKMLKIKHGVHVDSIITFSGELNVVAVLDSKPILDLRICFYEWILFSKLVRGSLEVKYFLFLCSE